MNDIIGENKKFTLNNYANLVLMKVYAFRIVMSTKLFDKLSVVTPE